MSPGPACCQRSYNNKTQERATIKRVLQTRHLALSLFATKGYANVGMRELASALGIGCGSIYNHIESKEALLYEFIEELYEVLYVNAMRTRHCASAAERLRAVLHMHLGLHDSMAEHFLLAEQEWRNLDPAHQQQALQRRERYEQVLMACLPPSLPRAACARSIVSLLNQAAVWAPFSGAGMAAGGVVEAMVAALLSNAATAMEDGRERLRVSSA